MTIHEMRICYPAYRQQEETLARRREIDDAKKQRVDVGAGDGTKNEPGCERQLDRALTPSTERSADGG